MSYRQTRDFVETMKALGYPRLISLENFRTPNFELVADCLTWLVHRFHPGASLPEDIATEAQRVKLLTTTAELLLTKARMRLNIKRLYAADGSAVAELLKLAELLHKATRAAGSESNDVVESSDVGTALKLLDVDPIKAAAGEIVRAGAALHEALGGEATNRDARARALAALPGADEVEAAITEALAGVQEGLSSLSAQLGELAGTEASLGGRLEKRRGELERAEKRLATLAAVRPAYMDEYEALQGQLQVLYVHYLERFRNLQYLEAQLEGYHAAEQEAAAAAARRLKKMQRRLAEEELRILRGEAEVDEARIMFSGGASSASSSNGTDSEGEAPAAAGGFRQQRGAGRPNGRLSLGMPGVDPNGPGGAAAGAGQVVGNLGGGWDDGDDSIDEDTATDGGELSMAGSEGGAATGPGGGAAAGLQGTAGYGGLGEQASDAGLEGASEDSGF